MPEVWRRIRGYCCVITADCQTPRKEICMEQEKGGEKRRTGEERRGGQERRGEEGCVREKSGSLLRKRCLRKRITTRSRNNVTPCSAASGKPDNGLLFTERLSCGMSKMARLREGDKLKNLDRETAGKRLHVGEKMKPTRRVHGPELPIWIPMMEASSEPPLRRRGGAPPPHRPSSPGPWLAPLLALP